MNKYIRLDNEIVKITDRYSIEIKSTESTQKFRNLTMNGRVIATGLSDKEYQELLEAIVYEIESQELSPIWDFRKSYLRSLPIRKNNG